MKKKLLVFHPIVAPYRIDFFNYLSSHYEMKLFMFHNNMIDQKFDYEKIKEQLIFEPHILDKFYNFHFVKLRKHIISTIKSFEPDIVLVPECGYVSIVSTLYKILFNKKYKVISIIDDSYDMLTGNNQFSKKHEIAEKLLIPLFDNIINVEPKVADFFQKKYNKGIFFPIIQDEERIRKIYQKALPLSEQYIKDYQLNNQKVILFVGRLVKLKNVHSIISAFNNLNPTNTKLIIIGSGEEEEFLKTLAKHNPNIIFTGRLEGEKLYAWYNIAEFFILPSTQEAFGAVTNEALIGGCYSLVSKRAGSSCLIKEGVNGNLFNPKNKEEINNTIKDCIGKVKGRDKELKLRHNLMSYNFKSCFENLIKNLEK